MEYGEVSLEFGGISGNGAYLAEFSQLEICDKLLIFIAKDLDNSFFKPVLSVKQLSSVILCIVVYELR